MHSLSHFFLACLFLSVISPLSARVIHVPDDSTTIQGGINGAVDGDTVMVAPGRYYENKINFLGKAITVMSTRPQEASTIIGTIVDANCMGGVFVFNSGEDSMSVLICFDNFSPVIADNIITDNWAEVDAGGIHCEFSSPTITGNIITENRSDWDGAGIDCWTDSSPTITQNIIADNRSSWHGARIRCSNSASPLIAHNTISANSAQRYGGGIYCAESSVLLINNNIIAANSSVDYGGGIHLTYSSSAAISNNIISGNSTFGQGAGIYCENSSPTIWNNTITGNSSAKSGAIHIRRDSSPIVANSIFWDNDTGVEIYVSQFSTMAISYCDLEGGRASVYSEVAGSVDWGDGMIDADPLFISFHRSD